MGPKGLVYGVWACVVLGGPLYGEDLLGWALEGKLVTCEAQVFVLIKGQGGMTKKLGFRPSRTLLDLIRARRPAAPRRPESPPRGRVALADLQGLVGWWRGSSGRGDAGTRGCCRRRAMTTTRGRSARDDGRAGSPQNTQQFVMFCFPLICSFSKN